MIIVTIAPVIFVLEQGQFHYCSASFYVFQGWIFVFGREMCEVMRHQFEITHKWDLLKILQIFQEASNHIWVQELAIWLGRGIAYLSFEQCLAPWLQLLPAPIGSWGIACASTWIYRAACGFTVTNYLNMNQQCNTVAKQGKCSALSHINKNVTRKRNEVIILLYFTW